MGEEVFVCSSRGDQSCRNLLPFCCLERCALTEGQEQVRLIERSWFLNKSHDKLEFISYYILPEFISFEFDQIRSN